MLYLQQIFSLASIQTGYYGIVTAGDENSLKSNSAATA